MKTLIRLICFCLPVILSAQDDFIHVGSSPKEPSAIVQFDATNKGVLIPRMTEEERLNIYNNLVEGLLVFDNESDSFWYFNGGDWVELLATALNSIEDGDGDTKIWTEKNSDEDILRFDVNGQELASVNDSIFKIDPNLDFLIGNSMFGVGEKVFFDNSKSAFRMGEVGATEWDDFLLGQYSIAFGKNTVASGAYSASFGEGNLATGDYATAFGENTDADGDYATSWGIGSQATGDFSVAGGFNCDATNWYATSLGISNLASGYGSTAFGFSTSAAGDYATTFGSLTEASGDHSVAMGLSSIAEGDNSTAVGTGSIAKSFAETVFGRYNTLYTPDSQTEIDIDDRLFVVGNGTSDSNRKDAFLIEKTGDINTLGSIINYPKPSKVDTRLRFVNINDGAEYGWEMHYVDVFDELIFERFDDDIISSALKWDDAGNLKIGTACCGTKISVGGNASKSVGGAWLANSDRRLKKEIETIDEKFALSQILKMKGVHYEWNNDIDGIARPIGVMDGFIAQDLQEVWPDEVVEDASGYLQTAYGDYDPMFVESFKAQQELIKDLKNEQQLLESALGEQAKINSDIKQQLYKLANQSRQLLEQIQESKQEVVDSELEVTFKNINKR